MSWAYFFIVYEEDKTKEAPDFMQGAKDKFIQGRTFSGGFRAKDIDYAIRRSLQNIRWLIKDRKQLYGDNTKEILQNNENDLDNT